MSGHKFSVGDTGLTRDGRPYRVICVDAKHSMTPIIALVTIDDGALEMPVRLRTNGQLARGEHESDLMPPKQKRWVNVYRTEMPFLHATKKDADFMADTNPDRIACIEIEFSEGQGL